MGSILIVDNHDGFRSSVHRYLTLGGFSVLEADSGPRALQILTNRSDVTLVVTDLNMPDMDGLELIRRIREQPRWSHIPIVVLSFAASKELQDEALALGAASYMQKPFSLPQFLEQVQQLLK